ncbi:hypothetical protein BDW72DRAFT_199701 [Aspergillus terricola var. indicus]
MALLMDEPSRRKRPRLGDPKSAPRIDFNSLPTELRLMIWEYTWPTAQVIEAASWEKFDDATSEELSDEVEEEDDDGEEDKNSIDAAGYMQFSILRPLGSFDTLLRRVFSSRPLETRSPLEECPPPIALWICHESRMHTLKDYALIQHPDLPECSFYFNPRHDLLWLRCDITSDSKLLKELQASYLNSLTQFRILLVEDTEWEGWDLSSSLALSILPALQTVVLIADDHEDDGTLVKYSGQEHREFATRYQTEYSMFVGCGWQGTSPQLEYIDRDGNSYLGTYIHHRMATI